jgi:NTP pyrophosphatase (non-canonical NTP hydrolase)
LLGEAGEVAQKLKKQLRDRGGDVLEAEFRSSVLSELGDCLWYISEISTMFDEDLKHVMAKVLSKLKSRKERNAIGGSGDNR